MNSILKWVGSKRMYAREITEYIKNYYGDFDNYYEPFFGGGSVFFTFEFDICNPLKKCYINDANEYLMKFYTCVKENYNKVFLRIENYTKNKICRDQYDEFRKIYNIQILTKNKEIIDEYEFSAIFYLINKTCFNGIYRVNSKGYMNTPFGTNRNLNVSLQHFRKTASALQNVTITSTDWLTSIKNAKKNDLIFLDPPYYIDKSSKFIGYTDPKFDSMSHNKMVISIKKFVDKGIKVVLCNSDSLEFKNIINDIIGIDNYQELVITRKTLINPTVNIDERKKFKERIYFFGAKNG